MDTQTPIAAGSSSSGNSSPLDSVSPLVWGLHYEHSRPASAAETEEEPAAGAASGNGASGSEFRRSLSPESGFRTLSLRAGRISPKVSRFLCREPPDGCEKVTLKTVEQPVKWALLFYFILIILKHEKY